MSGEPPSNDKSTDSKFEIGRASKHKSSVHEWINSAGVILAFIAASASAGFSYLSDHRKDEKLMFSAVSTTKCVQDDYVDSGWSAYIVLCWDVTISDLSEGPAVVSALGLKSPMGPEPIDPVSKLPTLGGWGDNLKSEDGAEYPWPFGLEPGKPKHIKLWKVVYFPIVNKRMIAPEDLVALKNKKADADDIIRWAEHTRWCEVIGAVENGTCVSPFELSVYTAKGNLYKVPLPFSTNWK